jgi:hypothetical protein
MPSSLYLRVVGSTDEVHVDCSSGVDEAIEVVRNILALGGTATLELAQGGHPVEVNWANVSMVRFTEAPSDPDVGI